MSDKGDCLQGGADGREMLVKGMNGSLGWAFELEEQICVSFTRWGTTVLGGGSTRGRYWTRMIAYISGSYIGFQS
jgi:hypothetical protein